MHRAPFPASLFCAFAAVVVLHLAVAGYLLVHLKRTHPVVWVELGSPSLFWNNSIRNNWLSTKFLWSARHRQLQDETLSRLVWADRVLSVIAAVLFLSLV